MRPLLSSTLLTVALLLPAAVSAEAFSFSDVPFVHPNAEAIEYVKARGVVQGYSDGTFKPDKKINRAEFVKMIVGILPQYTDTKCWAPPPFSDTDAESWYAAALCTARNNGLIQGYPDGTFRPAAPINFAEAAKIISGSTETMGQFCVDHRDICASKDPWYEVYVQNLAEHKSIPTSIDSFDQSITRGELAEMIYRLRTGNYDKPSKTYEDLVGNGSASSLMKITPSSVSSVTYTDPQNIYSISHPINWDVTSKDQSGVRLTRPRLRDVSFMNEAYVDVSIATQCSIPTSSQGKIQTVMFSGRNFTAWEENDGAAGTLYYSIHFASQITPSRCLVLNKVIGMTNVTQENDADRTTTAQQLSMLRDELATVIKSIVIY